MNYQALKNAMAAVGHKVSEGEHWLVSDAAQFRDFCRFSLGVSEQIAHHVLQYPDQFENHLGAFMERLGDTLQGKTFAPATDTMAAPVAAPVTPPAVVDTPPVAESTLAVPEVPAVNTPSASEVPPVVEPAVTTPPAPETPPVVEQQSAHDVPPVPEVPAADTPPVATEEKAPEADPAASFQTPAATFDASAKE